MSTPFKELKAIDRQLRAWGYEVAEWYANPVEEVDVNDTIRPVHNNLTIHTFNYIRKEDGKTVLVTWPRDGKKWVDKQGNEHSVTLYYPFYTEDGYSRIEYHCPYGALEWAKEPYKAEEESRDDVDYTDWPSGPKTIWEQYIC